MLVTYYAVECDGGLRGFKRSPDCEEAIPNLRANSKNVRADARRAKWWRRPAQPAANRNSAVDLCPPCAKLNNCQEGSEGS